MAAIRIENEAWSDPRYTVLAEMCDLPDSRFALILCGSVWSYCTERNEDTLSETIIDAIAKLKGFARKMVEADLAQETKRGIRVKGAKGRIEWLASKRKNGAKGGKQKASNRLASASESPSEPVADSKQSGSSKSVASYSYSGSYSALSPAQTQSEKRAEAEERIATHPAGGVAATRKPRGTASSAAPTAATWDAYASAYRARYNADPLRNATVNSQLASFLRRVPGDEAPHIAAHYVRSNNARYIGAGHTVGCLLQDAEKLRTEWLTGRSGTAHEARAVDRTSGRAQQYEQVLDQLRAEDKGLANVG